MCVLIFLTVIIVGFFSVPHYCLLFGSVVAHFWFFFTLLYFFFLFIQWVLAAKESKKERACVRELLKLIILYLYCLHVVFAQLFCSPLAV